MSDLRRWVYGAIVRLHPSAFRDEFGREMVVDFEDAIKSHGFRALWWDGLVSLGRQWLAHVLSNTPDPISRVRPSLLAGDYIMIRDKAFTLLELGRGLASSVAFLALCLSGLGGPHRTVIDFPSAGASFGRPETDINANPGSRLAAGESSNPDFEFSQSILTAFAPISTAFTTLPFNGSVSDLTFAEVAQIQASPELLLFHPSGPLPSYEVATIKPLDPAAGSMVKLPPGASLNPLSIRRYIMDAYGAEYAAQVIGGPDWLNKDAYIIHGKVPEDIEAALKKMAFQDGIDQNRSMRQSLPADRFHLKAHFETRVLPVYELVPAKSGIKITEVPAPPERKAGDPPLRPRPGDSLPPGTSMATLNSNGERVLNAHAIQMALLTRIIGDDAGNRPIVDHTGFTGYFDVTDLTWAPLSDAGIDNTSDAPSLNGALEKTLGLKLITAKDPIEVLVIDHIEKPSEN